MTEERRITPNDVRHFTGAPINFIVAVNAVPVPDDPKMGRLTVDIYSDNDSILTDEDQEAIAVVVESAIAASVARFAESRVAA